MSANNSQVAICKGAWFRQSNIACTLVLAKPWLGYWLENEMDLKKDSEKDVCLDFYLDLKKDSWMDFSMDFLTDFSLVLLLD